ncbi:MAG TPA: hypothetical protein VFE53_17055 [Mucilaginibacter sp.]|jgi:hypothetical protein|nr:hypothetical protein [Mucilaginibacter sp.]
MQSSASISTRSLQYYAIARHWVSDLEFFRIETAFLHKIMDDHFVPLAAGSHVKDFIETGKKLLELEKSETRLNALLDEQLIHLELMAEDVIPEDVEELEGKQVHLEKVMNNLTNEYRQVKKEMFTLVERVMHQAGKHIK